MGNNSPDNSDSENSDTQNNSPSSISSSSSIFDFLISNWKIVTVACLIIYYFVIRKSSNNPKIESGTNPSNFIK